MPYMACDCDASDQLFGLTKPFNTQTKLLSHKAKQKTEKIMVFKNVIELSWAHPPLKRLGVMLLANKNEKSTYKTEE